jgi:integrase
MSDPPIESYLNKYIERYVDPKYAHLNKNKPEDKYKLRQKQSTLGMLDICLNTVIDHEIETGYTISKLHFNQTEKKKIRELRPTELTGSDINSLIIKLKEKGMKPISISTYLSRASVFWKKLPTLNRDLANISNPWLMYDKDILTNGNKIFKKKPFRFNHQTLKQLAKTIKGKNIRPVVHLMYKLGLRRQEAVLLTKEQFFEQPTPHLYIQSKNTERIVYLNERQARFIKSLIREDKSRLFEYEVLGFDGSYSKTMESADLNIKQHDFRKDYISRMIEQVGISNSILLSQLLGHSTPRAIERMRDTFPEGKANFKDQSEILKQIGHRNSRITAEHYFSLK